MKNKVVKEFWKACIVFGLIMVLPSKLHAQKMCDCKNDFDIRCDTASIKNVGLLIRSCDADSIYYYFLPCRSKKSLKITSYEIELGGYDYRLGAVVDKKNKSHITFRFGCAANGPCLYKTYNLRTGKVQSN